mmetsp:Transcript_4803/g.13809  ORF Transcript_4803/g.13809 Transcript_4803/m.13809 type:complete len:314 (-) Transcript_4803:2809-3750(-)
MPLSPVVIVVLLDLVTPILHLSVVMGHHLVPPVDGVPNGWERPLLIHELFHGRVLCLIAFPFFVFVKVVLVENHFLRIQPFAFKWRHEGLISGLCANAWRSPEPCCLRISGAGVIGCIFATVLVIGIHVIGVNIIFALLLIALLLVIVVLLTIVNLGIVVLGIVLLVVTRGVSQAVGFDQVVLNQGQHVLKKLPLPLAVNALDHRTEVVYGVGVACSMQVTHGLDAAQAAPSLLLAGPLIHLDRKVARWVACNVGVLGFFQLRLEFEALKIHFVRITQLAILEHLAGVFFTGVEIRDVVINFGGVLGQKVHCR